METGKNGDIDMETWKHVDMGTSRHGERETWRHGDMGIDMEKSNRKLKPRRFSLIRLMFAHRANRSSTFVHLLTKKQMDVIRLQTD